MSCSLRDITHDATARSHARFDAAIQRVDLRRLEHYAGFLRSQAAAVFPLETALERHGVGDLLPDWEQRRRTPALEHDLAALDLGIDPLPVPELKRGGDHPVPEMLGVLYVLEGTRMSARVILARLADEPDPRIIAATACLRHGFGRRLWPRFVDTLEASPAARAHPARVIAGAQLGFGLFERALAPTATDAIAQPDAVRAA